MKSIVLIVLSSCLFFPAFSQDNITIQRLRLDTTTAMGKPSGEKVTEEIGKEGGRIFSADSRIELIIPEGALSKKKKITIQPVTNMASNGRGLAYQMEPSGLEFQKPATLIFHFGYEELSGTSAALKGLVWQDDKGKWQGIKDFTLDSMTRTLTTQINHFSSYASFDKLVLKPEYKRVKVEKSIQMEIHFAISDLDNDIALPPTIPNPEWSVNGVPGGNFDVGSIRGLSNPRHAKFTAPASVPAGNPVNVSARLTGMQFTFNRQTFRNPSLVSHLLIFDKAYRISMHVWVDNSEHGICTMRTEDRGEFTLILEGTRAMIKEIMNRPVTNRLNPCPCALIWTNPPNTGPIHTVGAKSITVTPASVPAVPFRKVRIMLEHAVGPMSQFRTACPTRMPNPPGGFVYLPPLIEFEANNETEQTITLSELTRGGMQNKNLHGVIIKIKLLDDNGQ